MRESAGRPTTRPGLTTTDRSVDTKHDEYLKLTRQDSKLVERGEYQSAFEILGGLLKEDISDLDKSMMCVNLAIVNDKLNLPETALHWYGQGVNYERRQGGHFVAESRAAYLAEIGRDSESLAQYEDLLEHPGLNEVEKERVRKNIEQLRGRLK